ncbi:MAG TPA: GNAT family N-acetyltransferase, partial [Inquilinus sp.]
MRIRDAEAGDVAGILEIYNDAVLHTTAIWNETVVDSASRAAWLAERRRLGHPVLVAVDDDGRVAGYASFGDWRAWDGYRHTVEHSVYVHR